jgi:hypothetical protein
MATRIRDRNRNNHKEKGKYKKNPEKALQVCLTNNSKIKLTT